MIRAVAAAFIVFVALAAAATERRYVTDDEAALFAGVGLVRLAGGGACTGALIRPDVVLTAAHCVADADRGTVAAARDVSFIAGARNGRNSGAAPARRVEVHPGYFVAGAGYTEARVRVDLARITLTRPIHGAPAYRVAGTPAVASVVALVSYSKGRYRDLSIQAPCAVARRDTEFLLLDCQSDPGASGAPYFRIGPDGAPRIVGVNSGTRTRGSRRWALALAFDHLRDFIGPSGGADAAPRSPPDVDRKRKTRLPGASVPGDGLSRVTR